MHLGTREAFQKLDYILYRFVYAIVVSVVFFYFINVVQSQNNSTGIIYLETWCYFINAIYGVIYLTHILRYNFKYNSNTVAIEVPGHNRNHALSILETEATAAHSKHKHSSHKTLNKSESSTKSSKSVKHKHTASITVVPTPDPESQGE